MAKLLNAFFLLFAAAMIVVVGFGDPGAINRAVNDFFGWAPNPPVEARMVDPAQAAQLRALVAGIDEADIAAEIARFAAFGSRVPGYAGERQARDYVRQRFEALALDADAIS